VNKEKRIVGRGDGSWKLRRRWSQGKEFGRRWRQRRKRKVRELFGGEKSLKIC